MNYRPRQRRDDDAYAIKSDRVHPDLKSYDKLDENTKKYDRAIVKAYPYLYGEWKKGRLRIDSYKRKRELWHANQKA